MANLETLPYYLYSMEINETAQATPRCKVSQGRDDKNANKSDETKLLKKGEIKVLVRVRKNHRNTHLRGLET